MTLSRHWSRHVPGGANLEAEWNAKFAEYEKKYKEDAVELKSIFKGELPAGWEKALPVRKLRSIVAFCCRIPLIIYEIYGAFKRREGI